jgi:hypothetical protein
LAFPTSSPTRDEPPADPPRASPDPARASARPRRVRPGRFRQTRARRRPPPPLGLPRRLRRPRIRLHAPVRERRRARELAVGSAVGALPMRRGAGGGRRARDTGRVRVAVVLVRAGVLEVQRARGDGRVLGLSSRGRTVTTSGGGGSDYGEISPRPRRSARVTSAKTARGAATRKNLVVYGYDTLPPVLSTCRSRDSNPGRRRWDEDERIRARALASRVSARPVTYEIALVRVSSPASPSRPTGRLITER